jgi:hypothetical protein
VGEPAERGHEGVLDRPFPALPGHRLGHELEDDPEVRPDHRADEQERGGPGDVDAAAGRLHAVGDEDDRQRVGDRPDEERKVHQMYRRVR